jgi:hypothetical protein
MLCCAFPQLKNIFLLGVLRDLSMLLLPSFVVAPTWPSRGV